MTIPQEQFDDLLSRTAFALLLGVLLEALARRGTNAGRRRTARLLLGTGLLGGFTTYSALATDSVLLLQDGATGVAIAYGLGSVLFGGVATWLGILIGAALFRRTQDGPASAEGETA
ncbi:CrcB family protein [Cryobacterium sp. Hb1]|uniref:CrcB family protein n=1 Tax=Cryobacterium sp. Hb1 TaxID=1259147 RepID=UPI00106B0E79|nr:CrcB family protein [Cryobacterium sp. Hb1]TFD70476.1 hypothetical protein E3T38_05430 [Cryobacterium sp. Hb1]